MKKLRLIDIAHLFALSSHVRNESLISPPVFYHFGFFYWVMLNKSFEELKNSPECEYSNEEPWYYFSHFLFPPCLFAKPFYNYAMAIIVHLDFILTPLEMRFNCCSNRNLKVFDKRYFFLVIIFAHVALLRQLSSTSSADLIVCSLIYLPYATNKAHTTTIASMRMMLLFIILSPYSSCSD